MDEQKHKVIEKIKKLLRLSKSSNEHEAALAATHAQRLLSEYNLRVSDVGEEERTQSADEKMIKTHVNLPNWGHRLARGVADAFDCEYYHRSSGKTCFIGVGLDPEVASYTFDFLYRTIRRLADKYLQEPCNSRLRASGRKRVREEYGTGASLVVAYKLREQKSQTPVTQGALVIIKKELIQKKLAEREVKTKRCSFGGTSSAAFHRGVIDGHQIELRKAIK